MKAWENLPSSLRRENSENAVANATRVHPWDVKNETGSRVQTIPRDIPSSTDVPVLLLNHSYVGMTTRHLHQSIVEHKYSSIGNHFREHYGILLGLKSSQFHVIKKSRSKFNCLVYEMLFIRKLKPSLNVLSNVTSLMH